MKRSLVLVLLCGLLATASVASAASPDTKTGRTAAKTFVVRLYQYNAAQKAQKLCSTFSSYLLAAYFDGTKKGCVRGLRAAWPTSPPPSTFRITRIVTFHGTVRAVVETEDKDPVTGKWSRWLYLLIKEGGSLKLYDQIDNGPVKP